MTTQQSNVASTASTPVQKTTEQERAAQSWTDITSVQAGYAKQYGSLVRKVPMLVLTNGLAATMAFLLAKGRSASGPPSAENQAHKAAYDHISGWVMRRMQPNATPADDIMAWIRQQDSIAYRRATTEALAYLNWLKRFAEAQGWGEEGGENATA